MGTIGNVVRDLWGVRTGQGNGNRQSGLEAGSEMGAFDPLKRLQRTRL